MKEFDMYRSIFYARESCCITFNFITTLLYDEWTKNINATICEKGNIRKSATWKLSIFRYPVLSCNFRHRTHLNKKLLGAELSNTSYFAVALGVDFFHQEHILYERIIWPILKLLSAWAKQMYVVFITEVWGMTFSIFFQHIWFNCHSKIDPTFFLRKIVSYPPS